MKKNDEILEKYNLGVKIDLGCGENKQPGFLGIDYRPLAGVDIVHNIETFPYPLPDECATTIVASHILEHIEPHGGVFMRVMNELWRLLKPNGELILAVPYAGSPGYYQDPTHCNPITEVTLDYFDPLGQLSGGGLYRIYRPLPWQVKHTFFQVNANLEAVMVKRLIDVSYNVDPDALKILTPKKNEKK